MVKNWHALSIKENYQILKTSEEGLTDSEAKLRLKKYGLNNFSNEHRRNLFILFLNQFKSPLIYILLITAIITFYLNHALDSWIILGIVIFNAVFGFSHEIKAEKAMESLKKLMALKARVKRDGDLLEISSLELVPGDIVEVSSGTKIPADLRIINQFNLTVDESILTGESMSREKNEAVLAENVSLGDRNNMLFGGTIIISGKALGIVVKTGIETEFGKITQEINETEKIKTPLQIKFEKFSKKLILIILIFVGIIFLTGIIKGLEPIEIFLTALSAAISAIPEGLPAIITVALATGAFQMAKRKAIVRKLIAVETLGSVDVIASDKTGTLTTNQMTVERIYTYIDKQIYKINGSGYEPKGEINPLPNDNLVQFLNYGVLCNDSEIIEENEEWIVSGDPTEGALITVARKTKIFKEKIDEDFPRLDEIPFDTKHGFMATLHQEKNKSLLIVKGKVEKILEMTNLNSLEKEEINKKMNQFADSALRIIALAVKKTDGNFKEITQDHLKNLEFLGFFGMIDPPRHNVVEAIKACKESGIKPIVITGDYSKTAQAIALDLGIINKSEKEKVISGEELEKMDKNQFELAVQNHAVFARISPEMKLKIVESLQSQNKIVAVTGDGVNDAPALKKSDVGIAMGVGGTDVSREVADLVLSDNNFTTIVAAIEEGRTVYQNIRRAILFLLSTNMGELFIFFTAIIIFPPPYNLPLLPIQILWLNLVTDGMAGASLALEPTHKGIIKHPPRPPEESIVNKVMFWRIILVSLTMLFGTLLVYNLEIINGSDINRARSIAFAVMVTFQVLNVLNCRSMKESIFKISFFSNKYILWSILVSFLISLLTIYLPFMRMLFRTVPLTLVDWFKIILVSSTVIIVIEIEKWIRRRQNNVKY